MTNEADMLEAAAKKLRDLAEAATPGPWRSDTRIEGDAVVWGPVTDEFLGNIAAGDTRHVEQLAVIYDLERGNSDYIAAMSPPVALGFAKLLDNAAEDHRMQSPGGDLRAHWDMRVKIATDHALAVARAILGPGWAMQQAAADLASIEQEDA